MPSGPVAPFLDALRDHSLLTSAQQDQLARQLTPQLSDPRALARHLLQQGWLTPYQANQLLQGRGAELVMGPYLLLERLGEGGTGQVFKARHQRMDRVVAIKLIRADLLTDPEVVQRFYREVQVLSQLSHPNVVHAYDAGPIGATHFLVMEYVEGTDLSQLVKRKGPMTLESACSAIRQAAAGLAHAHEKGLVHRDIKPSNLFLSLVTGPLSLAGEGQGTSDKGQIIKILDLGLARLRSKADGDITTTLTPVGSGSVTMGTPDYLAPEQALDFHQVDIRADIYSLGCTFFYLLTGQPPFPGGSMAQKLMRHQQVPPPPLSKFRTDVPPAVEAILKRMLAKRAQDRFQTPAEVLTAFTEGGFGGDTVAGQSQTMTCRIEPRPRTMLMSRLRKRPWLIAAGVGALMLSFLTVALAFIGRGKPSDFRVAVAFPSTQAVTGSPRNIPTTPTVPRTKHDFVLQGRPLVQDVCLDLARPGEPLGSKHKDNQLFRQDKANAFLVFFDLPKAGVPARGAVEKASLSFYVWDPCNTKGKTKVCAFPVKTWWNEATATWEQAARNQPWKGGKNFTFGVDTGPPGPHVVVLPDMKKDTADPPIEYRLDVTAIVQSWLEGGNNYGIAIGAVIDRAIDDGFHSRFQIYASEHPRVQYTPKLTIQLQP